MGRVLLVTQQAEDDFNTVVNDPRAVRDGDDEKECE